MPTRHGGSLPKNSITWPRLNCFLSTGLSEASTPCTWKTFLARSIPIVLICMWTAPSCDSSLTITLWHIDAGSGRRPPHQARSILIALFLASIRAAVNRAVGSDPPRVANGVARLAAGVGILAARGGGVGINVRGSVVDCRAAHLRRTVGLERAEIHRAAATRGEGRRTGG